MSKPKETVDKYLKEIISDLKSNIHSRMWRTRESCSNALGIITLLEPDSCFVFVALTLHLLRLRHRLVSNEFPPIM